MKGKLVILDNKISDFNQTGVYLIPEQSLYEVHIDADLNDDYMTLISKDYDFDSVIDSSMFFYSDDKEIVNFLKDFKGNRIDYIKNVEYVEFNCDLLLIGDYINRNPILKSKKIIINVDFDINRDFLSKVIDVFGDDISYVYFNIIGNSDLVCFDDYMNTVDKLETICNNVERFNFSPLEKIMYVYDIVRDKVYLEVDDDEDKIISRSLSSSLLGDKIVCVGYAVIFKTLLSKLGIRCLNVSFFNENKTKGHARCEVYVKDDKYGVDGVYYFDPTWDSKKKDDNNRFLFSYRYFAMIKTNVDKLSRGEYTQEDFIYFSDDFLSLFKEEMKKECFEDLNEDLIKSANHMYFMVKNKHLISKSELHPSIPQSFKPDIKSVVSKFESIFQYYNKPISADTMLKVLYNVRKNQYYMDDIKYPLGLNEFYIILLNSGWEFDRNSFDLFLELMDLSDKDKKKEKIIRYAKETDMFKEILQVKVTHTLRKVLVKKSR